jgi:hypothetical protein
MQQDQSRKLVKRVSAVRHSVKVRGGFTAHVEVRQWTIEFVTLATGSLVAPSRWACGPSNVLARPVAYVVAKERGKNRDSRTAPYLWLRRPHPLSLFPIAPIA